MTAGLASEEVPPELDPVRSSRRESARRRPVCNQGEHQRSQIEPLVAVNAFADEVMARVVARPPDQGWIEVVMFHTQPMAMAAPGRVFRQSCRQDDRLKMNYLGRDLGDQ